MRMLTFTHGPGDTTERLGVESDGLVLDLAVLADHAGVRLPHDLLSFVQAGPAALEAARSLLAADPAGRPAEAVHRIEAVSLRAPCAPARSSASASTTSSTSRSPAAASTPTRTCRRAPSSSASPPPPSPAPERRSCTTPT